MEKDEKIPARNASHNDAGGQHKIVETYAEDMAKAIKSSGGGLIKKIIHGEEEHEREKKNLSPESKKNRIYMLVSLLLVFFALFTLSFFLFNESVSTVPVEKQFTPLIFTDKSVFFEVKSFTKDEITQTVLNEVGNTTVKEGGVEGIYLTFDKKVMGLRQFTSLIKSSFTPDNANNFVNDNFLLGVVDTKTKPARSPEGSGAGGDFFILLKVRTITDVFDSLRAWENKMFLDLHGFFGINLSPETKYLLTAEFQNGIVENKNARILYKKNREPYSEIIMMYVFADNNSVIITNTKDATHEIMLRLASSQIEK